MRKVLLIVLVFMSTGVFSQRGKVMDNLFLPSEILEGERKYAIYIPPDYETSNRKYPVLYLLHGSGDDQTGWVQFGEVLQITDKAIEDGSATPMIIVMPDANSGKKGYFNSIDNSWNYENFFFKEFIPFIEKKYRIKSEKRFRAIAGLSMGGGGSFIYALRHPEMFSSACPLSGRMGTLSYNEFYEKNEAKLKGFKREAIYNYYSNHNALSIIKNQTDNKLKSVRWYIDCGDDDYLFEGNSMVHVALKKRGIPHEYRVRDGSHNWTYWRSALPSVLGFVTAHFHK
ncbi:MAG: 1,4-beta-xylanase [Bacteroidetes bacterium MED-G20]|nr:MAG: 1,4-beta-xylanase [Bacteroidetes bacterium MED-G20]|tara:strand:- start:80 stop:934 length:855 start_codon:yes stop_codon:yes gene_type:complete